MSGFIRPSEVGPRELKRSRVLSFQLRAPTATIPLASAAFDMLPDGTLYSSDPPPKTNRSNSVSPDASELYIEIWYVPLILAVYVMLSVGKLNPDCVVLDILTSISELLNSRNKNKS